MTDAPGGPAPVSDSPSDDVLALRAALAQVEAIARDAGQILLEGWDRRPTVEYKSAERDVVTEFDRRAEALVVARLAAAFPDAGIVGEEGAAIADRGQGVFYVDPLDGTVNFAHGLPLFAVSIGLLRDGVPVLGVVHAPALGWTFAGGPGLGAHRNDRPIAPSLNARLDESLLVTGFPTALANRPGNTPAFVAFNGIAQGIRRLGSAALDLCFVACGWLDGTWQRKLSPWDTVGAAAILQAAGARITELDGRPFDALTGDVLASNGLIHDEMIALLARTS
ncbi:MAG TPA: inositol monophosphatase family protein [Polyangia bacterium]